jgi:glycosyltransferase involved in cell wall biosynthesis
VIEGETGFLVDEGDVSGMAEQMVRLAGDPTMAGVMGRTARSWIEAEFSMPKRIGNLRKIIHSCLPSARVLTPSDPVVAGC